LKLRANSFLAAQSNGRNQGGILVGPRGLNMGGLGGSMKGRQIRRIPLER